MFYGYMFYGGFGFETFRHYPEEYRWKLFEALYHRSLKRLQSLDINSISIIVGPEGYQADARIFYRPRHSSIVHIVESHLKNKYR